MFIGVARLCPPEFLVGLLLVLFVALELGWLPATGYVTFADVRWVAAAAHPAPLALGVGMAADWRGRCAAR